MNSCFASGPITFIIWVCKFLFGDRDGIQTVLAAATVAATIAIAWFTYSLRNSTNAHAGHMENMLSITRDIERAYLYPIIAVTNNAEIREYIRECFLYWKPFSDVTKTDTPSNNLLHLNFKIKNYGKTPGTIYRVYAEVGFWPRPTGAQLGISIPEYVLGASDETGNLRAQMNVGLSRNQVQHINGYTGYLALVGTFIFGDIWGKKYTTEFVFCWDKDIERMTLRNVHTKEEKRNQTT